MEIAVAFHHNISGMYENKQSRQWDPENRKYVVEILNENKVKIKINNLVIKSHHYFYFL